MTTKPLCEELNKLNADAVAAFAEAKRIRRQRDVSFHEDAELSRDGHRRIDALVKHLLAGHDGEPCPNGDRPIISIAISAGMKTSREKLNAHHSSVMTRR
jgi:hypothetical protein